MNKNELLHRINNIHHKGIRILLYVVPIILLLGLVTGGYSIYSISKDVSSLKQYSAQQEKELRETQDVISVLLSGNDTLALRLSEEQQNRILLSQNAESEKTEFQDLIHTLKTDLDEQKEVVASAKQAVDATNITSVVETWSPQIAKVSCSFLRKDGTKARTSGSGTLTLLNGEAHFLTNTHVLEQDGLELAGCQAKITDITTPFILGKISASETTDKAYIAVTSPTVTNATNIKLCSTKPSVGDRLVILGYPSVGSSNSVTATEGIISGFDDGYYVSSAKIENGNSGGAAILIKDNCFVGIPTLVVKGKLESLARILPI